MERKREAGGICLIRAKGHSTGAIYIVKALRLISQLFLSMFCLTDSFPHRERGTLDPVQKQQLLLPSPRHILRPIMRLVTSEGVLQTPSGLGGATSLSSKGSHMVWEIATRSWRASVKALLGIETISFASNSIGLHLIAQTLCLRLCPKWRTCLSCSLRTRQ